MFKLRAKNDDKKSKGQGIVEFSLIIPIVLLVLLGIIEGAWLIWAYITVQNSAQSTARYAVTGAPLNAEGDPWTNTPEERAEAIKQVAKDYANFLPINAYADWSTIGQDYETTLYATETGTPNTLGILITGQTTPDDTDGTIGHPGNKGLFIEVRVYYNAPMLDPIYNTVLGLVGGGAVHLTGRAVLQNEGINAVLGGEPPDFAPPLGDGTAGDGGATPLLNEVIEVILDGTPTTEIPAGSNVDIILSGHAPNTEYYICFDGSAIPASPVTSNASGGVLISGYNIPLTTDNGPPPGVENTFISSTSPDCSVPAATLNVSIISPTGPIIEVNDLHADHNWPDNSIVPLIIATHDPTTAYTVYFDGVAMCNITTDTTGNGVNNDDCVIPDGIATDTYPISTTYASNTLEVNAASLDIKEGLELTDNRWINIILRDHAPGHNYYVYFNGIKVEGTSTDGTVETNGEGQATVSYYIPANTEGSLLVQTQDRSSPLPPSTTRRIASLTVDVEIPTVPTIIAPKEARAGEVIIIQLRVHDPNTEYEVKLDSTLVNGTTYTTDVNGDVLNIQYKIPSDSVEGVYDISSFFVGSSVYSATREIEILSAPYLEIEGGDVHSPAEDVTILVRNHVPNTSYDYYLYLDLDDDGDMEDDERIQIAENLISDSNGDDQFVFTIPATISPLGVNIDAAHKIASFESSDNDTDVAAVNLYVVQVDLTITTITLPTQPQPGLNVPVGVHVKNNSEVTLTNAFPFDNDVYFDPPPGIPNYGSTFPPGDDKIWISSIAPSQTIVITPFLDLFNYGSYDVYGRTDTSDGVAETLEFNNILSTTMVLTCTLPTFTDNFDNNFIDNSWTLTSFGNGTNAGLPPITELLEIEAEDASLSGNFTVGNSGSASGGQYAVGGGSSDYFNADGINENEKMTFNFVVSKVGNYRLQGNVYAASSSNDSFWVRVNGVLGTGSGGNSNGRWNLNQNTSYQSDYVSNDSPNVDPMVWNINAQGTVVVEILLRERGARLDKLTLIHEDDWASVLNDSQELYAMQVRPTVDPTALALVAPPALPVLSARPQPMALDAAQVTGTGSDYTVETAAVSSKDYATVPATLGLEGLAIPVLQGSVDTPTNLAANAVGATQVNLTWNHTVAAGGTVTYLSSSFNSNDDGWNYNDISNGSHVTGNFLSGSGNPPGSVRVRTGGTSSTHTNIAGGWSNSFNLPSAQNVTISLDYRYIFDQGFDSGESGAARLQIDGTTVTLASFNGTTPNPSSDQDSGWQSFSQTFNLAAGNHTITLIGYNSQKSTNTEISDAYFDNVNVSTTIASLPPTAFEVERSLDGNSWSQIAVVPYPGAQASYSYSDTTANCDTEYFYRVRAGNEGVYSSYSNTASDRTDICTILAAPIDLDATTVGPTAIDVAWSHPGTGSTPYAFVNEDFSADQGIFQYSAINNATYVVNSYDPSQGNSGPGSIRLAVGNVDNSTQTNSAGRYSVSFNLPTAQNVTIQFGYRMIVDASFEGNEDSEVRYALDGGTATTLATENGGSDTGWQNFSQAVSLSAGPHTLHLIGYNEQKTEAAEVTNFWFDDVVILGSVTSALPDGYELERSLDGSTWDPVATITPYAGSVTYPDTGLACNTQYTYRVRAIYTPENVYSDYSNLDSSVTSGCAPFPAPTNLVATADVDGSDNNVMNLTWTDNSSNENGFRIERSLDGVNWTTVGSVAANTTSYQDVGLTCETLYTYRVVAFRDSDGATVTSNTDSDTTATCPIPTCTYTMEDAGVLTLCSSGNGIFDANDNNKGYLFMNRPVNEWAFDMHIRLDFVPFLNNNSVAGLEIRDSLNSTAKKVNLVIRNGNTQQVGVFNRLVANSVPQQVGGWTNTAGELPTWLRIERANGFFTFYYNTSNEDDPPVLGSWTYLSSVPDTMTKDVVVGMINASAHSSQLSHSEWQQFYLGCPGNATAVCGIVSEDAGQAVVNGINYTDNYQSKNNGDIWGATTRTVNGNAYAAMTYSGDDYTGPTNSSNPYTNGPMLEYSVNIETPGTYYVWVLGYSPNSSGDSLNIGVDGLPSNSSDKVEATSTGLSWFNSTADNAPAVLPPLSQGIHTINVWGREDDFEIIQILLTTQSPGDFVPTVPASAPATLDQSDCLVPVPPEFPPNQQQCTAVLQNTSFEGGVINPIWQFAQTENVGPSGFPYPEVGGSWSLFMPASVYPPGSAQHNAPFVIQSFEMPAWLNSETVGRLDLFKAVQKLLNPDFFGVNSPNDFLYFVLRDQNGVALTENIPLATGADNPIGGTNVDPNNPADDGNDWVAASFIKGGTDPVLNQNDVFRYLLPGVELESLAGTAVQVYIYAPNPGAANPLAANRYSTNFYIDKVTLEVCTTQPEPPLEDGKGHIKGRLGVLVGGTTVKYIPGVRVWAYQVNGPLLASYTVNAATFSNNYGFYNVDPGEYIIYSQFVDSDGNLFGAQTSRNVFVGKSAQVDLTLVAGGSATP